MEQCILVIDLLLLQFEGMEINLDKRVGIFITMNPGYAGRSELPESVKALFRPVVVIVPDLQQICEIMLFSEGFLLAKVVCNFLLFLRKMFLATVYSCILVKSVISIFSQLTVPTHTTKHMHFLTSLKATWALQKCMMSISLQKHCIHSLTFQYLVNLSIFHKIFMTLLLPEYSINCFTFQY